ncbi:MAG TPA: DUF3788 domain-containing protein [Bacteroidales bacterium]|nr:DUF3788 domain-containing protein [Bacteroidales bacterium]HNZ43354.1 DUF3788 domain-containing protein [Bacteroidales bacterium]HOH84086.1 DUF3788 domain-containing protein [Bacteroidales bacterium]HPB25499.1 DUF3788 domain-containing protein [Bacteroidales bacterium]HPI30180.1 DUF3788 domain-containing protein [Bacteroidales bacterium]
MSLSIFDNKSQVPTEEMLAQTLQDSCLWWNQLRAFVIKHYPSAMEEWKHSGKNYGWGFRLKDKKRAIIYLTPADGYFLFSVVFGEKATQEALQSTISDELKEIISTAKVYAEGRGIRIEVKSANLIGDLQQMILIKLKN